jgi:hypothetical protein
LGAVSAARPEAVPNTRIRARMNNFFMVNLGWSGARAGAVAARVQAEAPIPDQGVKGEAWWRCGVQIRREVTHEHRKGH